MPTGRLRGYGLALTAAALWATIGLFYKGLEGYGLSRLTIVFYRAAVAAAILFPVLTIRRRAWPAIARRDWPLFIAFGIFGVAAFYVVYIYAIALTGVGVAAVLMYTAPAWVTLLSIPLFQERLTPHKVVAVVLAIVGCALVGRVYNLDAVRLNYLGVLAGLGAGLTYGFYTLFSKAAQRRYDAWVTLAYALALGTVFMLPFQSFADLRRAVAQPGSLFWLVLLGLGPTLGAGLAFNGALRLIPASNVSIVATLEPAIATLLGWAVLGERLEPLQLLGTGFILAAVVMLHREAALWQP